MTFKLYRTLLENSKYGVMSQKQHTDAGRFQSSIPAECPKCGCQTKDPFGFGHVIHDVEHKTQEVTP